MEPIGDDFALREDFSCWVPKSLEERTFCGVVRRVCDIDRSESNVPHSSREVNLGAERARNETI
jgi:hypothetical protein